MTKRKMNKKRTGAILAVLLVVTAVLSACRATPEGEKTGNALVEAETKPESEALAEADELDIPERFQLVLENEDGSINIDAPVVKGDAPVTEGTVSRKDYTFEEIQVAFAPDEEFEKSEEMSDDYSDAWISGAVTSSEGEEWNKMISMMKDDYLFGDSVDYLDFEIDRKIGQIMEAAPLPKAQKEAAEKKTKEYVQALHSNFVPAAFQYSFENGVGWTRVRLLLEIDGRLCSYGQLDKNVVNESNGIAIDSGTEATPYGEFQFSDKGELGSAHITNEYQVTNQAEIKILPFDKIEERMRELFESQMIHAAGEVKIEQIVLEYMLELKAGEKGGTYKPVWAFKYTPSGYAYQDIQNYVLINAQTGELEYYSGL